jgi:hypothetical protein
MLQLTQLCCHEGDSKRISIFLFPPYTGVLLLHNNASLHSAVRTRESLQELKSEALDHQSYSPDIALSYYFSAFE